MESLQSKLLSVLRVVAGFLFLAHGTQKLFGFPSTMANPPVFPLSSLLGAAGALEVVGGPLILIGLFTRPVAFILAGEMAYAYFKVHARQNSWPLLNNGEVTVLYCFLFLYFSVAGGGEWSLDRLISRRRPVE